MCFTWHFNASCDRSIEDCIILLSSEECGDINDIKKSSSILQNQNAAESRRESHNETNNLANHPKVAMHMATTPRGLVHQPFQTFLSIQINPCILNFLNGNLKRKDCKC